MEVTPVESSGGRQVVSHQESFSSETSQSESTKQVGNSTIAEKSASFASEEVSQTVEKSATQNVSRVVQSSVSSSKDEVSVVEKVEENQVCISSEKDELLSTQQGETQKFEEDHGSKALEIITKYIEDGEPPQEAKENLEEKKEEKKTLINRQTSTTSLEEAYLKRLSEKHFQNLQELLIDTLPAEIFDKPKRPPSVEPHDLYRLLQSVQIAQELNRMSKTDDEKENQDGPKENNEEDENSGHRENKPIDLEKLFTPASDSGEITPAKSRKMFASSSFYSPIHPTVEDQVKLARRISSSLCDISNKQSKGQSMYVNRMKRSVKWVHGGGEEKEFEENISEETNVPAFKIPNVGPKEMKLNSGKDPLKLIMNPLGKIQDINSLSNQGQQIQGPLTPEKCFDLVRDLNTTKGKGAELFAKRRKRSEKWVVDETNVKQVTSTNSVQQQSSVTMLEKTYTQNTTRQDQIKKINEIQERFSQPRVKLIKSPWEAALETGSVDTAFQESGPVFPTSSTPLPTFDRLPTPARATPVNEGVQKQALLLPNIPRGWGSAQTRQLTYGSVKLNPADPIQPVGSKESGPNSQSANTSASGTAFFNQSHTSNTTQQAGFKQVRGPQEPILRSTSPFPGVFVPHPKTTSPPRDLRRLIHPESLRPHPLELPKTEQILPRQPEIQQQQQVEEQFAKSVKTEEIISQQQSLVTEDSRVNIQQQTISQESSLQSITQNSNFFQQIVKQEEVKESVVQEEIKEKKIQEEIKETVVQEKRQESSTLEQKQEIINEQQDISTEEKIVQPATADILVSKEPVSEKLESTKISQEVSQVSSSETVVQSRSEIVKMEMGNQVKQLNIDEEIHNIDSEIQSLTREMETQEIFDQILSDENKFIREQIPANIVSEIIQEELLESKRLENELKRQEEEKRNQEQLKKNEAIQIERQKAEGEQKKKDEYQKMLFQQEYLKLTPYQIQAREEKTKLKKKHMDETRVLQGIQAEEMKKLKIEHAQQTADLTLRQQKQNKTLSEQQMTNQLNEMTYLQKLQKQKLGQEHFLQQQRVGQKQKEEEKQLQVKLDDLDFAIQEQYIKQQEEERRLLEQKRYEEEVQRMKEEQERLLQLEKEREAILKIEKEKFLQEIYREQCLKMLREQGVTLSGEEMVEFLLGLGIEVSLDQVEKFGKELEAEHEAIRKEEEALRKQEEALRKDEEERQRRERELFNAERQKSITEKDEVKVERKISVTEKQRKISRTEDIELPKFKDEAEAEEYVLQQTLKHKQQIEQKQAEEKQVLVEPVKVEPVEEVPEPTTSTEEAPVPEVKEKVSKPADQVPGAVPIFGVNLSTSKSSSNVLLHEEMQKRTPQKSASEAAIGPEEGVVYESKPFKDLVETFEGNSRPATKLKHVTENPEILRSLSGVDINESIHKEIVQQKSETIYEAQCSTESRLFTQENTLKSDCRSRTVSRAGSTSRHTEMQVVQQLSDLLKHSEPTVVETVHRPYSGLGVREPTPLPPIYQPQYQQPQQTLYESPLPEPTYGEPLTSSTPSRYLDYTTLNNYNTAPRGWKQNLDYYRPVTFTPSTKLPDDLQYTDY